MIEILLAFLQNFECFSCFVCGAIAIILIVSFVWQFPHKYSFESELHHQENVKLYEKVHSLNQKHFPKMAVSFLFFLLIALTPSINDVWLMRIALIKYQLASPENISKATDEITRIGHLLECKYIGCNDKEEQKK